MEERLHQEESNRVIEQRSKSYIAEVQSFQLRQVRKQLSESISTPKKDMFDDSCLQCGSAKRQK